MRNGDYELVIAPEDYQGKRYRGKYCYAHILAYWEYYHDLPKDGEIIHHKNGDKRDNRPENLEKVSVLEHISMHTRNHLRKIAIIKCPVCGKCFITTTRKTHLVRREHNATCCSRECSYKLHSIKSKNFDEYLSRVAHNVLYEGLGYITCESCADLIQIPLPDDFSC